MMMEIFSMCFPRWVGTYMCPLEAKQPATGMDEYVCVRGGVRMRVYGGVNFSESVLL